MIHGAGKGCWNPPGRQSSCVYMEVLCWKQLQPLTAAEEAEGKWEMEIFPEN